MRTRLLSTRSASLAVALAASCQGDLERAESDDHSDKCEEVPACAGTSGSGDVGAAGGSGLGGAVTHTCQAPGHTLTFNLLTLPSYSSSADFAILPDGEHVLLAERRGALRLLQVGQDALASQSWWDLPDDVYDSEACGLTNVLLDPEFEQNHFVYLSYCSSRTNTRVVRITLSDQGLSDLQVIFEIDLTKATDEWHRLGSMAFEPDGKTLWLLSGEQTMSEEAQNVENAQGALLRIQPARKAGKGGYSIPSGNWAELQAQGQGGAGGRGQGVTIHPAIYAFGLRSPWRGTQDAAGRFFIGDVGNVLAEEINLGTRAGQNFGWNLAEGPCTSACDGLTDPLVFYDRTTEHPYAADDPLTEPSTKRAIWVGQIYQSPSKDRYCGLLDGVVPFGDFFTGWVRGLRANENGRVQTDELLGHLAGIVSWKVGPDGYAYVLTYEGTWGRVLLAD